MRTTYNGSVEGTFTSLPFGDGYSFSGSDNDPYHYATLDKDYYGGSDSQTDHAQFRQYSDAAGRWMSPDPYDGSYDISNPQSFNRYSYVLNNPLSFTDPTGQFPEGAAGCLGGPAGCVIGIAAAAIFDDWLFNSLFGGPSFHGSLKPRPNAQPWDEYNIHYGPNIAGALGLPDAGCEFGACGGGSGFLRGAGPYDPTWSKAQKLAYIAKLVSLLNVSGVDNKIVSCVITDEEDPAMDPSATNPSGAGFGAIGLMQVRQVSLNDVNRAYGLTGMGYTQSDLSNANANVFIGSSNIGNHVRYAHGNVWEGIRTAGDGTQAYVNRIKKCSGN